MPARNLNHVSIVAKNLEESVRFYEEVFGLERIPTPNFGHPVQWLRVGDLQLHIFERPEEARRYAHFALSVDDLVSVYEKARARGCLDGNTFTHYLVQLPNGNVQLYVRDPAGNLIEVDWPSIETLPPELQAECVRLADRHPQNDRNRQATLFLEPVSTRS
jgi:catechol 2,3-dioxygenase-like lactoylglutathione lyase family enzyme